MVGDTLGAWVGDTVGFFVVGTAVGIRVGACVGAVVGSFVGSLVGAKESQSRRRRLLLVGAPVVTSAMVFTVMAVPDPSRSSAITDRVITSADDAEDTPHRRNDVATLSSDVGAAVGTVLGPVVGDELGAAVGEYVGLAVGSLVVIRVGIAVGAVVGAEVSPVSSLACGAMTTKILRSYGPSPYIVVTSVASPVPGTLFAITASGLRSCRTYVFTLASTSLMVSLLIHCFTATCISKQTEATSSAPAATVGCAVGESDGAGVGTADGTDVRADDGLELGACDAQGATSLPQNSGDSVGSAVVGTCAVGDALGLNVGPSVGAVVGVIVGGVTVGAFVPFSAGLIDASLRAKCRTSTTFAGAERPLVHSASILAAISASLRPPGPASHSRTVVRMTPVIVGALVGALVGSDVAGTTGLDDGDPVGCVDGVAVGTDVSRCWTMFGATMTA